MAAFNPDAYAGGFDPDAYAGKEKRPFNSALDSFGRGMTMAPASALLDAVTGQGEGDFGQRFKSAKAYYDAQNQRAQQENPNAYTGGQIATGILGSMATLPIASAVGPMSALSRGGGSIMGEALSPGVNALVHAGAGVMDASLANMGIAAATASDKGAPAVAQAMQQASQSPMNLMGAAGAIPDVIKAAPAAAQEWRDTGNRMRTRRIAPQDPEMQRVIEERHGTQEVGGEALRGLPEADQPGQSHRERGNALDYVRKSEGATKGGLVELAESRGATGNAEKVIADLKAYRNRKYGSGPTGNAVTQNVPEDLAAMQALDNDIKAFEGTYREQVVGVSRELPEAAVTPRQPPSVQRGGRIEIQPEVRDAKGRIVQQGRSVQNQQTTAGEPGYEQTIAGERPAPPPRNVAERGGTPETARLRGGVYDPERGRYVVQEQLDPGFRGEPRPDYVSDATGRPMAPEEGAARNPGTMRPNEGAPVHVNTEVQPAGMWSRLKTRLDKIVNQRGATAYPAGTPAEVIKNDPKLQDTQFMANRLREEERAMARATLTPEEFKQFETAMQRQHDAETFFPFAKRYSHGEQAGANPEAAGILHPSRAGTVAWTERLLKGPSRSRIGIPFSDWANERALVASTKRASPAMNPTMQAVMAEILRKSAQEND